MVSLSGREKVGAGEPRDPIVDVVLTIEKASK
jgi:hypothetical protein